MDRLSIRQMKCSKKVLKQGFDDDDASLWIKVEKFILLTGPGLKRDVFLFFF